MKNPSLKEAMFAALPSPGDVRGQKPGTGAEQGEGGSDTSSAGLGVDALSAKKQDGSAEEQRAKIDKMNGLRPLL